MSKTTQYTQKDLLNLQLMGFSAGVNSTAQALGSLRERGQEESGLTVVGHPKRPANWKTGPSIQGE
jgi:hypothetical protein